MIDLIFLLSIPAITAFIGWITNLLAIRMLFRPRQPIQIFGYRWQGLIPKRQTEIAQRAAELIEREILSQNLLRKELEGINFEEELGAFTRQVIHERMGDKLRAIPLVGAFLNDSTLTRFAEMAAQEVKKQAPNLKHRISLEMENRLPIRSMIEKRIASFDLLKLEEMVHLIATKEFRAIEYLGAILGFVIGLLQLLFLLARDYL